MSPSFLENNHDQVKEWKVKQLTSLDHSYVTKDGSTVYGYARVSAKDQNLDR